MLSRRQFLTGLGVGFTGAMFMPKLARGLELIFSNGQSAGEIDLQYRENSDEIQRRYNLITTLPNYDSPLSKRERQTPIHLIRKGGINQTTTKSILIHPEDSEIAISQKGFHIRLNNSRNLQGLTRFLQGCLTGRFNDQLPENYSWSKLIPGDQNETLLEAREILTKGFSKIGEFFGIDKEFQERTSRIITKFAEKLGDEQLRERYNLPQDYAITFIPSGTSEIPLGMGIRTGWELNIKINGREGPCLILTNIGVGDLTPYSNLGYGEEEIIAELNIPQRERAPQGIEEYLFKEEDFNGHLHNSRTWPMYIGSRRNHRREEFRGNLTQDLIMNGIEQKHQLEYECRPGHSPSIVHRLMARNRLSLQDQQEFQRAYDSGKDFLFKSIDGKYVGLLNLNVCAGDGSERLLKEVTKRYLERTQVEIPDLFREYFL